MHSSVKARCDETARSERIQRARRDLGQLGGRLAGPRARISTLVAAEEAAAALLAATGAQRWISVTVTESTTETIRQEKRGRLGKNTRYRNPQDQLTPLQTQLLHLLNVPAQAYLSTSTTNP